MALSDEAFEALMGGPHIAVIGTVGRDGAPHQAPVWFEWRDGAVLVPTQRSSQKWRNIQRDPRVSLCIEQRDSPMRVALIRGLADEQPADYMTERRRFYARYHGADAEARMAATPFDPEEWLIVRIRPEKVVSFGAG
jgi:PPOX class probable F420-dependent enzyme